MARIVLCLDDDPDDRELIRNAIYAIDPSSRIAYATNGKDGKQALEEIKKDKKIREMPLVVFTTSNHSSDLNFCSQFGVELVTKPTKFKEITSETSRILQHCAE